MEKISKITIRENIVEVKLTNNAFIWFGTSFISAHGVKIDIMYVDSQSYLDIYHVLRNNTSIIYNKQMAVKLIQKFLNDES